MKSKIIKAAAVITAAAALLASCSGESKKNAVDSNSDFSAYPIKTSETLTYWMPLSSTISVITQNYGDTPFAKELEKKSGVKIEYIHPTQGQDASALSLMIASDELADIVETDWLNFQGGPSKAISNEVIVDLTDYMDEYAPNLKKFLKEHPDIDKSVKTDDGRYYCFPFIRNDKSLLCSAGYIIRNDWLNELGLTMPNTVDELENVLTEFKNKKGAAAPVSVSGANTLTSLMNVPDTFYKDGDTIKYGPVTEEYKAALTKLNDWFNKGLIDKNFVSADSKAIDSNILNGKTGVAFGSGGSGLGRWLDAAKDIQGFDLAGMNYTVMNEGDKRKCIYASMPYATYNAAAITTACKNIPLAMKFLDYAYSDEGYMLFNFGIEGESYEMKDGYPKYTELIMKNPDGLNVSQAMGQYFKASGAGPFVQDKRYIEQYYEKPQQQEALKTWTKYIDETLESMLPQLTPTADESSEYANIMSEVEKYRDEMRVKFITGIVPISDFDSYVQTINQLGIEKALKIKNDALERYNER